jgi:hypothetical protein
MRSRAAAACVSSGNVARKLKAAVDLLYTALNADQKKTADEIMLSPTGMMM